MQKYADAEKFLGIKAAGMNYGRAHYNHGQVLLFLGRSDEAEKALTTALSQNPQDQQFFIALADFYIKSEQTEKAQSLTVDTINKFPDHKAARDLLKYLSR